MARLVEHDREELIPITGSVTVATAARLDAQSAAAQRSLTTRVWSPVIAAITATLAAFMLSAIAFAVPVFAMWLTAPEVGPGWDTWPEVAVITGTAWLAAQGLPVVIAGATISILPWGLAIIPVLFLLLAGRWTARAGGLSQVPQVVVATITAVIVYAGLAVAVGTWLGDVTVGPGRILATTGFIALVAFGWGAMRAAGITASIAAQVPSGIRRVAAASGVTIGVLILAGAVAVGASLLVNADHTHRLLMSLAPDAAGLVALIVLSLGYLPILIGWAVSYILGIGFVVSAGAVISPLSTSADVTLPVFPLLGALPPSTPTGAAALPIIGLIAGMLGAHTLKRRGSRGWVLCGEAAAMIAIATAALAALLLASSGSLGAGLLSQIGPIIGPTLGVASLLWVVGSLIIVIPVLAAGSTDPARLDRGRTIDDSGRDTGTNTGRNRRRDTEILSERAAGFEQPQKGRLHGQHHP